MTTRRADGVAAPPPARVPTRPRHSADRRWWFDGRGWVPAVSPEGRHWFDGQGWVRNRPRAAVPVLLAGLVTLLASQAAIVAVFAQAMSDHETAPGWVAAVEASIWPLLAVGLIGLVAGIVLVRRRPVAPVRDGESPPDLSSRRAAR
ncbi:MAG: hypothetical protein U0Q15_07155 [Kineosporiaceae bacterium]